MKVKAKTTIKYKGNRYPPGSIFTLQKGDESLAESKSVEAILNEEAKVSSDKKGGDNSDSPIPQRSRKATKNKGGDGD